MSNLKSQCIICFDENAVFQLCDEHGLCETCLPQWVNSISAETIRSKACDSWILCPGSESNNNNSNTSCSHCVPYESIQKATDTSTLMSIVDTVWATRCDEFISLFGFHCPNTKRCGRMLDPDPDACTAMMCPTCGTNFCFACFERFQCKEDAHAHVPIAHDHEDPFLPKEKILHIHRLIRAQAISKYLKHMHINVSKALCSHFCQELTDLDLPTSPEELNQLSVSEEVNKGAGAAPVPIAGEQWVQRPPIAGECLSDDQESELMSLANLRRWADIKHLVGSYREEGLLVRFNSPDHFKRKVLQAVITYPDTEQEALELTQFVLDNGGSVDEPQEHGHAPLKNAIFKNYVRVAELLLQRGANIELRSENNLTAMQLVGELHNRQNWPDDLVEMGLLLMRHGAKYNSLICSNVVIQCCLRDPTFARIGTVPGVDVTTLIPARILGALPMTDENLLMQLVDRLRWSEMKEIVTGHRRNGWKVNFNGTDFRGVKMLQAAIAYPTEEAISYDLVLFILDNGGNVNERQEHGYKALVSAVLKSFVKVAELLIDRGADLEARGGNNLITAMECAGELHDLAGNPDAYVDIGVLLMHRGAKYSSPLCRNLVAQCCIRDPTLVPAEIVEIDAESVTDETAASVQGTIQLGDLPLINETELIEIAGERKWDSIKTLVDGHIASGWRVRFNAPDGRGVKMLQAAIMYPDSEKEAFDLVEFVLDRGGLVDEPQERGYTPLITAVFKNYCTVAKLLLDKGASVDLKGVGGALTALESAGELYVHNDGVDRISIATLLLVHNADPSHTLCTSLVAKCRERGLGPLPQVQELQIINLVTSLQWDEMKRFVIECEQQGWNVGFTAEDKMNRKILQCVIQSSLSNETSNNMVAFVLDHGGDANASQLNGATPLFQAVLCNRYETVGLLLDRGVDLEQRHKHKNKTAFELVCEHHNNPNDRLDRVKMGLLLLSRGAVFNSKICSKLVSRCREDDPTVGLGNIDHATTELEQFRREQAAIKRDINAKSESGTTKNTVKEIQVQSTVAFLVLILAVMAALWYNMM